MYVKYVQEENVYLITNHVVACNFLFTKKYYSKRFLFQFTRYMGSLCELISYSLDGEEFILLVRLKDRSCFEDYYIRKKEFLKMDVGEVPATTYIFSQAMANFQASMAIHFNRRERRSGALFARRFRKKLVLTEEEVRIWVKKLESRFRFHRYRVRWRSREAKDYRGARWYNISSAVKGKGVKFHDLVESLQGRLLKTGIFKQLGLTLPFLSSKNPRPT